MSYWTRVGTIISQGINALLFGGHPDMSLSTRALLQRQHWFWYWVYVIAEAVFDEGHCERSLESDLRFAADLEKLASGEMKL